MEEEKKNVEQQAAEQLCQMEEEKKAYEKLRQEKVAQAVAY